MSTLELLDYIEEQLLVALEKAKDLRFIGAVSTIANLAWFLKEQQH